MDFALIGGRQRTLSQGWMNESLVSVLGGTRIEATAPANPDARMTVVTIIGATVIRVPIGSRVRFQGFTLLGSRTVAVRPGDGPEIMVRAYSVVGSVTVTDSP